MDLASEAWQARDRDRVWHPYSPMPAGDAAIPVVSARGSRLRLADGREVIDGMSSWWAAIHGYRHPVLDDAVRSQLGEMAHVMFGGLTHAPAIELAELLVSVAPPGLERVFFTDSGSVAIEVAMKMAVQYWIARGRPERHRMLTVRGGYHGDTLHAMSVCDPVNGMHRLFASVLPRQIFADRPAPAFGDRFTDAHIEGLARQLDEHAHEVAAVIIEPVVQGAGGMYFYAPNYVAALRRLCDRYGVLLIADEIATGFGRSGRMFACEHADVAPDIMCVGKALTGGYLSMAATLCTAEVAAVVSNETAGALMHGPTFMGNPLAAAVSLASIRLLLAQPWEATVSRVETTLRDGLAPAASLECVDDVRVLGGIGVIETTRPLPAHALQRTALDRGVWIRPFGRLVYAMPPYICSDAEVSAVAAAMVSAVAAAEEAAATAAGGSTA